MRLLICDDEPDVAASLKLLAEQFGAEARTVQRGSEVAALVGEWRPDLVLTDLRMPGLDGRGVVTAIRAVAPDVRVVVMSAYGSLDTARDALSWGADDYIAKPIAAAELRALLERAATFDGGGDVLAAPAPETARFGELVGASAAMRHVYRVVERIAPFPTTVLLQGESGVGKELVARELHRRSPRAQGPFVAVNCAAIPESLLESELFGYKRGAFTGADRDREGLIREAHGGTLLLDEIGDLPLLMQVKLLRVIQEGRVQPLGASQDVAVDVRWVAASLRDLEHEVATGRFRQDLYFRLNVMRLELPPLRARRGDLRLLIAHVLAGLNERYARNIRGLEAAAYDLLAHYDWPGNVRELENLLERAFILTDGDWVTREAIAGLIERREAPTGAENSKGADLMLTSLSIKREGRRLEELLIRRALQRTGGNRTQAAKLLEISNRALLYKIKEYGIDA